MVMQKTQPDLEAPSFSRPVLPTIASSFSTQQLCPNFHFPCLRYATFSQDLNEAPFCGTSSLKGLCSRFAKRRPVCHYSSQLMADTNKCLHSPIPTGRHEQSIWHWIWQWPPRLFVPWLMSEQIQLLEDHISNTMMWEIRKLLTGSFLFGMRLYRWSAWLGVC